MLWPRAIPVSVFYLVQSTSLDAFLWSSFMLGKEGIVLATERKVSTILIDETDTPSKISMIAPGLGVVYSGMGPDARVLVSKARKSAQGYWQIHKEWPTALQLVKELAAIMQEYTQSGYLRCFAVVSCVAGMSFRGVRPFGVSLLVAGFEANGLPGLYQVDPSGSYWAWKASAIGKNMVSAKSFLEKR
jgi:20S proteasome subunit alpha 2